MIGAKQIEINAQQFLQGMSTTDYSQDGGFGNSSVGINPLVTPGVMRSMATETDASTNLSGNIIASIEDSQAITAYDRLFVDDAANYYTLAGGSLTKRHTGVKNYIPGTTDMVSFSNNTYVSSDTDVAKWNTSTLTLTESWFSTLAGSPGAFNGNGSGRSDRHPLLVFENFLWIADGSKLHTVDPSGVLAVGVLILNPTEIITALGIDPVTGLMLISTVTVQNIGDTRNSRNIIYVYDGYSAKPRRKILIDDMVTAFHNVGGQVFIGYGARLGTWNGNGITFLRNLENAVLAGTSLPYKQHFSNIGNTLLVINGPNILAYGELSQGGRKVFWYPYKEAGSSALYQITNVGNTTLYIAKFGTKLTWISFTSTAAGAGLFYTNMINFPRPATVHMVRVITDGMGATSGGATFATLDEKGNTIAPAGLAQDFANLTGATKFVFDFQLGGRIFQTFQARINFSSPVFGITRIIIYYDQYE